MKNKINKWLYQYVVQGNYGYGWDDLVTHNNRIDALNDYKWYKQNEQYPHRIIKRRTLNKDYKLLEEANEQVELTRYY